MLQTNNKIRAIIIDDEKHAVEIMEELLGEIPEINIIGSYTNPFKGLKAIERNQPDLVFLDIKMPDLSGIEILQKLQKQQTHTHVVMTTAFDEFILDALKNSAIDYILKPIQRADLKKAVEKYLQHHNSHHQIDKVEKLLQFYYQQNNPIIIPTAYKTFYFQPNDIVYLEADRNYTNIFLADGSKQLSSYHLGKIENDLPSEIFMRIGRACIVNRNCILHIDKKMKKVIP